MIEPTPEQPHHNEPSIGWWARLQGAIRFLTIVPLPEAWSRNEVPLAKSVTFFPTVGGMLGTLLIVVSSVADSLWDPSVRAIAVVVVWGTITAGLHLDGLSDTFDGVMSWRSRERKLEIMRDSRIGVMGALALIAVLSLKGVLIGSTTLWLPALLLAPLLGRWAICYGLCRYPSARADGLGAMVQAHITPAVFRTSTLMTAATVLLVAGLRGLVAFALVWLVARWLARWWTRDLGGLTGDTYGALCEISEVVALAALTAQI